MYPALAIRQALGNDANPILWVGSEGGMEADLVQRAGMSFTPIPSGQVAGMGLRVIPNLIKVIRGTLVSRRILKDFQPDVLLFTGGFVAVPMALAARNYPSLVYVPDIEPGMALKLMTRFASIIALTSETSRRYFPPKSRTEVTGYPTRTELKGWTREKAIAHLGLNPDRFILLVTGGSKGARSLNRALVAALPELLQEMQIIHLTGKQEWAEVQHSLPTLPVHLVENYHPLPYLHEMGAALAAADLAISRAGASTLGELPLFGLPAILVPYPHAWRYQKVNADFLVEHGAAQMLVDASLPEQMAPAVLSLARDPERLQRMRQAMTALALPQAGQRLADLIRELAKGSPAQKKNAGHTEDQLSEEKLHG